MGMMGDLHALSIVELETLIENASALLESKRTEALRTAREEIARIAAEAGLTVTIEEEGKSSRKSGRKAAQGYRNPRNPKETWAGRGKRPKWVVEALASGKQLEDLRA